MSLISSYLPISFQLTQRESRYIYTDQEDLTSSTGILLTWAHILLPLTWLQSHWPPWCYPDAPCQGLSHLKSFVDASFSAWSVSLPMSMWLASPSPYCPTSFLFNALVAMWWIRCFIYLFYLLPATPQTQKLKLCRGGNFCLCCSLMFPYPQK